jgi:hypothetical protein
MSLELLERWRPLLAELGDLGDLLGAAILAHDVVGAVSAMARMRQIRAAIARVEAPIEINGNDEELAAIRDVSQLTARARGAEAVMLRWLARELPGDATLLATPLGAAVLGDAMLPPVWDYASDLVVLIGHGLEQVAEILGDLGQRRIVVFQGTECSAIGVQTIDELCAAVRTMVPCPPSQMIVRTALGIDRDEATVVTEAVRGVLGDLRVHRNTVQAFSPTWLAQGAANLDAIARWPSIDALGDRFAGKPMIIVAPGPSLAQNAHLLRELKGRAVICAFSHSLKPVIAAGVDPDLVLTVDPQDVRYHFEGCDVSRTCLVNAATVHPTLFQLPAPRALTLSANCAIDDWIFAGVDDSPQVPGGGSVATTALSLALRWRCEPIIFVGLDLSFPGGTYYVASSHDGAARAVVDDAGVMSVEGWSDAFRAMKAQGGPAAVTERAIELPGWHGGTVPSSFMFSMFHRWFVDRMRDVTTRVYNCTEGGAFIAGMQHEPLADVIATLPTGFDVTAILDDVVSQVDRGARSRQLADRFGEVLRDLRKAKRLARRARMLARRGTSDDLAATERKLGVTLERLTFISLLAQRQIERAQDIARRDGGGYLEASAALFDTLLGVIDHLEPVLRGALDRLRPERRHHGRAA